MSKPTKMTNRELETNLDKAVNYQVKLLNTLAGRNITDADDLEYLSNTMNIIVDNMDKAVRRRFGVAKRQEELDYSPRYKDLRRTNK